MRSKFACLIMAMGVMLTIATAPASAAICAKQMVSTEILDGAEFCASSALNSQGAGHYGPDNASIIATPNGSGAWCEGVKGPGIGEWISVEIFPKNPVRTLMVTNGYQKENSSAKKSRKAYNRNGRVRGVLIENDNGLHFSTTLEDKMDAQNIRLPGWVEAGRLRLTILSVYPGSHYSDACLTMMWPDLEEYREEEWKKQNE